MTKKVAGRCIDRRIQRRVPLIIGQQRHGKQKTCHKKAEAQRLEEAADRYLLRGPLPSSPLPSLPPLAIPATLHDSLLARLDHLGPASEIAQLAAVIGREFSWELLDAVAPIHGEALAEALKSDPGAIESAARETLGLLRPGEIIVLPALRQ